MRIAALAACLTLLGALPLPAAPADDTATIARHLAENILGKGQVRSSRTTNGGRGLAMTWESATYRPQHAPSQTRELLEAEAGLAWGAILRVLRHVEVLEFEITLNDRRLCTGTASRARPMVITYSRDLGG
jgi:hypothetical protein